MKFSPVLFTLALVSSASGVTVTRTGFTVDENEPHVLVTEVGRPYGRNDLTVRRFDASTAMSQKTFAFDAKALMYTVGVGRSPDIAETNVVATLVRAGDRWTAGGSACESRAVRITSVTVRGSVPEVTVEVDPSMGSTVTILGKESLGDAEWVTPTSKSRFFKAVQTP